MKTVQEYLREVDEERLIKEYMHKDPTEIRHIKEEWMTVGEVKEAEISNLRKFIERLRNLEIKPSADGRDYVLFAYKAIKDDYTGEEFGLVCWQELLENEEDLLEVTSYAYEFSKQEEIMGYKVSDAEYTQDNIYELLADVMYEASFFGFDQVHLEEEQKELQKRVEECDGIDVEQAIQEGSLVTWEDVKAQLGFKKKKKDPQEDFLYRRVFEAQKKFFEYCYVRELRELLKYPL